MQYVDIDDNDNDLPIIIIIVVSSSYLQDNSSIFFVIIAVELIELYIIIALDMSQIPSVRFNVRL